MSFDDLVQPVPGVSSPREAVALLGVCLLLFVGCGGSRDELSSEGDPGAEPVLRFTDVTEAAGLDFVHQNGARGEKLLPETMGGGVAFADLDGDEIADLLFIDSAPWPDAETASTHGPRLFRGDGTGAFTDVTDASGLRALFADDAVYGMGVALGDVDADGRLDLFVTALDGDRLLRGVGEPGAPRFVDATEEAGVGGGARWSTGAAFADFDGDGWLDLAVARYVVWSRTLDLELDFDVERGARGYRPPFSFPGLHPSLYRNRGDGTFEDVTAAWGLETPLEPRRDEADAEPAAKALAVLPVDLDEDGDLDLFVANDTTPNLLYENRLAEAGSTDRPGSTERAGFTERGVEAGIAFAPNGLRTGAMGVDFVRRTVSTGDELSIAVGNFSGEATSLFVTRAGSGLFDDLATARGLATATRPALTFGLLFLDADLDGVVDLLQVNGHIEPDIALVDPGASYEQEAQLFLAEATPQGARYRLADDLGDLTTPVVGRGLAAADMDADGDLDLVVTQIGRRPVLWRNDRITEATAPSARPHWLRVRLRGEPPNVDAIGARVTLETADGSVQHRTLQPARSYLSAVERPLTFGLGAEDRVTRLVVHWPDGSTSEERDLAVDRTLTIDQAQEPPS